MIGQFGHVILPRLENFVTLALEPANTQRSTKVVKDQRRARNRAGQIKKFLMLMVVMPTVQR